LAKEEEVEGGGGGFAAETLTTAGIAITVGTNKIATRAKPIDIVRMVFPLASRDRYQHGERNEQR
jgi:hypothetical protein